MKKLVFLTMVFALSGCAHTFSHGRMMTLDRTPTHTKGTFLQHYARYLNDAEKLSLENEMIQEYEGKFCGGKKLEVQSKRYDFNEPGYLYDFECK